MTSIDENDHGEQEDEEDEWEIVWEPVDHMQEVARAQQPFSDLQRNLENAARIAAGPQIESPALLALQRIDQLAAAGTPAWLDNLHHTEEMLKRAQGLRPVPHRKQRANTPGERQAPERPSMPPRRECAPSVTTTDSHAYRVVEDRTSGKRGRGNHSIHPYLEQEEFDMYMREYVSKMQRLPSQPAFIRWLDKEKRVVLVKRTLGRYAINYHGTDWRGCAALFAHLIRQR